MKAFQMAVERQVEEEESEHEEQVLEFAIGGEEFVSAVPTPGQASIVIGAFGLGGGAGASSVFRFLRGVLKDDGYQRIQTLLERGKIDFDMLWGGSEGNEEGVVDWLISKAAARPTRPQSGSSESSKPTGKKSTGRSPGKGSTLSD